jgi:hypothetical protein
VEKINHRNQQIIDQRRIKRSLANIGKLNRATVKYILNESMNHDGENMDVLNQEELYHILKASQASRKRRNENAEGERKREDAKNRYVRYFSRIFVG